MSDWIATILLGVIEGITEFLPISSTGHLLAAEHWLGARSDLFNVVIQSGAMLAVVAVYRERLLQLLVGFARPENRDYVLKLGVAFAITAVLGLVVSKLGFKLPTSVTPVAWALVLGAVWMLGAEAFAARKPLSTEVSWTTAILVGVAQIVAAIFPGTSRSSATIFVAMVAGTTDRAAATDFAFLVGIPTLFAAGGYELMKQAKAGAPHEDWAALGVAFVVSMVTAFVAVKWLLGYIRVHRYTAFAVYRIALGAALFALA